ncbi:MAG: SbmA protein [Actinomycetia bacterium]|nr:SbmA protein [Actinomycetes bacterium]
MLAEPLEVLDTPVTVEPQLLLVYVRTECRVQVGVHVIGTVVEPARLLHRGAATQVYFAAGLGGGPARPGEPLEDEHLGAGGCRLHGGRRAGAAEPDDQHVSFVVEPLDGRQWHRSNRSSALFVAVHGLPCGQLATALWSAGRGPAATRGPAQRETPHPWSPQVRISPLQPVVAARPGRPR